MYTLQQFLARDHSKDKLSVGDCARCKKPITNEHGDDVEMSTEGPMHSDCHWAELGDLVEKHPPGLPHAVRSG